MTLPCTQIRKIAILLVLTAVLGGCSSTRLMYAFAGGFIQDEVAYFLDLDEEEDAFLTQQVTEMVAWHRRTVLPNYATYLTDVANKLAAGQHGAADIAKAASEGRPPNTTACSAASPTRARRFIVLAWTRACKSRSTGSSSRQVAWMFHSDTTCSPL